MLTKKKKQVRWEENLEHVLYLKKGGGSAIRRKLEHVVIHMEKTL